MNRRGNFRTHSVFLFFRLIIEESCTYKTKTLQINAYPEERPPFGISVIYITF